jgi:hypothetical protein
MFIEVIGNDLFIGELSIGLNFVQTFIATTAALGAAAMAYWKLA